MKFNRLTFALVLTLVLLAVAATTAFASIPGDEPGSCAGDNVSGTVVAVDPSTNMVTIDTGDGLCTVTLSGSYDHPIVTLLGAYFGDVSVKTLEAALQDTTGCALYDEMSETWAWADCGSDDAVPDKHDLPLDLPACRGSIVLGEIAESGEEFPAVDDQTGRARAERIGPPRTGDRHDLKKGAVIPAGFQSGVFEIFLRPLVQLEEFRRVRLAAQLPVRGHVFDRFEYSLSIYRDIDFLGRHWKNVKKENTQNQQCG